MTTDKSGFGAACIAKINPPKIGKAYSRIALTEQLQAASHQSIVWISAPAGAGKTTLVASYLANQPAHAFWYQVDAGDNDPATFFHYLALIAHPLRQQSLPLPPLTKEYHGGLATFTRRFTERLCEGITPPAIFVFDNFQELAEDSPLHPLLNEFINALPTSFSAFFLSREKPPAWIARFAAQDAVHFIDAEMLRLSEAESIGIARLLGEKHSSAPADEATIRQIHQTVDGWAAGLILMLRLLQKNQGMTAVLEDDSSHELIFAYFASELFDRINPQKQAFLLQSALLPMMTEALVTELTGEPCAGQRLRDIHARNFFLTRSVGRAPVYKYHPLFRDFLLKKGEQYWDPVQRNALQRKASQVLLAAGQLEAAANLALSANDWQAAISLITSQAGLLITQGRNQMLLAWLDYLPEGLVQQTPWLLYWQGIALDGQHPAAAERCFAAAYPLFESAGEVTGMYLTIAGVILMSWMTQQNHQGIDLWLQRFDQLYATQPDISPPDVEARVVAAVLMGFYFRQPDHPQGKPLLERARYLWNQPLDANLRWLLGSAIGFYLSGSAELIRWSKTVRLYTPPHGNGQPFLPEQLHLLLSFAFIDCFAGSYAASRENVRQGLLLANNNGIHIYDLFLLAVGVYDGLMQGKLAEAEPYLDTMHSILATQPPNFHTVHYRLLLNWRALLLGKFTDAVDHAEAALELALANGAVYPIARCQHGLALALFTVGKQQAALQCLRQARIPWGDSCHQQLAYDCGLSEAWFLLRMGDEDTAASLLHTALEQGKAQGWGLPLWSFPDWTEAVLRFALEQDIATTHVQQLIRQAELIPQEPTHIPPNWPMPVRIQTLGSFKVEVDGKALTGETPSKNRPLELLQTLIAFGGRDVADTRLMDTLWPDASGDAATRSLNTTLHRLRKILGTDHAILLKDRSISLDSRHVWLDVWAFEHTLERLRQQLDSPHPKARIIKYLWDTFSTLYAGSFLSNGVQKSWTLDMAERLRSRMLRFTQRIGAYWEQEAAWEQAIRTYRKGLETAPLIEAFYQGLMRCYESLGRPSEALASYEHCREVLGKGLGIMPGAETLKLYKDIRARAETAQ